MALRSEGCPCTDHRSPAIDQLNIEWKQEGLPSSQFSTWLSTRNAQSQCSRVVCVYNTALYGSTRAVDTLGGSQVNTLSDHSGQWKPVGLGRWKSPVWISSHSQQRAAQEGGKQNLIRCLLQKRGKPRNPEGLMLGLPSFLSCQASPGTIKERSRDFPTSICSFPMV